MVCKKCKGKMVCANSRALDNVRYRRYRCVDCGDEFCTEEREIDYQKGRVNIAYCSTLRKKQKERSIVQL